MFTAGAEYLEYEARTIGATPAIRVSFLPYYWPTGVNAGGTFNGCAYVAPDRIQADYHGSSGGYWTSPVLTSQLQMDISPAVIIWVSNSPGYVTTLFWRSADTEDQLAAAAWTPVASGGTVQIKAFYQLKITLEGIRSWAVDAIGDADDFTAYAVDSVPDDDLSYAGDDTIPGDPLTYIEAVQIIGEFTIIRDIEEIGTVTQEAPQDFSDLVSGEHSGLVLSNRQKAADGSPAPLFSPNKTTFILANQEWYGIQLRIELGWSKGGWFQTGFMQDAWQKEEFTEFITLFLGKIITWGPVTRAVDVDGAAQPATVEIYANDWVTECLQKRVALPKADGSPNPLTFGEFLCPAEKISGWTPAPIVRSAYFQRNNFAELDGISEVGDGSVVSIGSPGILGEVDGHFMRTTITGPEHDKTAYGKIMYLGGSQDFFITGIVRFTEVPGSIPENQTNIFEGVANVGTVRLEVRVKADGTLFFYYSWTDEGTVFGDSSDVSSFSIIPFIGVPLKFSLWVNSGPYTGHIRMWIDGDEILTNDGWGLKGKPLDDFYFGVRSANMSGSSWVIDWGQLNVYNRYYQDAYQATGGPFASIGAVYVNNTAEPADLNYYVDGITHHRIIERLPQSGVVSFTSSTDIYFKMDGDVIIRVVEHAGGRHALEILESLFALAGLTDRVDPASLAAAYIACPDDIFNARFEGGESQGWGEKDYAGLGIPIADCIKEITSRCLYFILVDAGLIKIIPYTGTPPANPIKALTGAQLYEASQTIDLESINEYVTAIYGWYDRNQALNYTAGDPVAGGQGTGLDFSWDGPVVCELFDVVKAKADLLLKFLSAKDLLDPVRMNLSGARVEILDVVSVRDDLLNDAVINYIVMRKEIGLDPGSRETFFQLTRILGE